MKVFGTLDLSFTFLVSLLAQISNGYLLMGEEVELLHEDGPLCYVYPGLGEEVPVIFLTAVRHKRHLSAQTHHIIQLQVTSKSSPVTIHLSKSPVNLVVKDGSVVRREEYGCIYTGVVSGGNGSAAFSACSATHAFTGHLILEDEHYVMEPFDLSETGEQFGPREYQHKILHRVYRTADILAKENSTATSDSIHVPFEEIEKGLKKMGIPLGPEEDDTADELLSSGSLLQGGDDGGQVNSALMVKSSGKQPKKVVETTSDSKIVDLAVFLDTALIKKWRDEYGDNGKKQLMQFVMSMLNNMNLLFQQSSLTTDVSLRLVYVEYLSEAPSKLQQTNDGRAYLNSFCAWAGNKNSRGRQWDHGLLLTGLDLKDKKSSALGGIALFSTICIRHLSCSIGEARSFLGSFVMTHEIGHSLGMNHDGTKEGTGTSVSCDGKNFIMSSTTGEGKLTWSPCSSDNLKELLRSGIKDLKTKRITKEHLSCLDTPSSLKSKSTHFKNVNSKLPGELYSSEVQCHLDCGDRCTPHQKNKPELCTLLRCRYYPDPQSNSYNYIGYHPALEGTKCGTGKWCRHGQCVEQSKGKGGR